MSARMPNEENDDEAGAASAAAAAAAAFQTVLRQQVRPFLGWDPVSAMAAMQNNLLQQQQQQHQDQHQQPQSNSATINQPAAAMAAAGITPPTSLATGNGAGIIPPLWAAAYGLPGAAASGATGLPPTVDPAAAAASLASMNNTAAGYLNHLQTPESFLSFQQNLLLLEQIHHQRQLLAANPHLLMATAAAQNSTANLSPQHQQTQQQNNHINNANQLQHQHLLQQEQHLSLLNSLASSRLLANQQQLQQLARQHTNGSPKLTQHHGTNGTGHQQNGSSNINGGSNSSLNSSMNADGRGNSAPLLAAINTNFSPSLTNQHQDSLVDQHFRRSLGEDYNQILSSKQENKINIGK